MSRSAMASAATKVEAIYELPFLAHATMEPVNCTVHVRPDGCDVWVGTQVASRAQAVAAQVTGLPPDKVLVHNHLIGGGFGRRLEVDFVTQAVAIAKQVDAPVKVMWSREEDVQHDIYRPYYYDRIAAGLDTRASRSRGAIASPGLDRQPLGPGGDQGRPRLSTRWRAPPTPRMRSRTCSWSTSGRIRRAPASCGSQRRRTAGHHAGGAASGRRTTSSSSRASSTSWRRPRSRIRSPIAGRCSKTSPRARRCSSSPRKRPAGGRRCRRAWPGHLGAARLRQLRGAGGRGGSEGGRGAGDARGLRRRLRHHRQSRHHRAQMESGIIFGISARPVARSRSRTAGSSRATSTTTGCSASTRPRSSRCISSRAPSRPAASASPARRPSPRRCAMRSSPRRESGSASCPWIRRNFARCEGTDNGPS